MSYSGSQQADLMQSALVGSYESYLEWEGAWLGDSSEGSINIPWLLGIALAEGNASTKALGEMAWTWPEPEWGWDATGPGQDTRIQQWVGGATGGWIRSW
jgi:hypothetical protein